MILTGGPEHLYLDQTPPAGPRDSGFTDGLAGTEPTPDALYGRPERAAYYQGHIRGTLARIKASHASRKNFTPTVRNAA